ncbi:kinase-like domain-containing protein [Earliella scabrosa]|nr:kinase-like domain-containing protein [Earliella scabrosa]
MFKPTVPRSSFLEQVTFWMNLSHPNVLNLFGASLDGRFCVVPFYGNGSLLPYLKSLPSLESVDMLKMVHEIARGMAYLHSEGVVHGALKAANVLVGDRMQCILTDFDLSKIRPAPNGLPPAAGSLRWQAPELMSKTRLQLGKFTPQSDVYSFAITVVELLTVATHEWFTLDNNTVRDRVLDSDLRPEPPQLHAWSDGLASILQSCWPCCPNKRLTSKQLDYQVQQLRSKFGAGLQEDADTSAAASDFPSWTSRTAAALTNLPSCSALPQALPPQAVSTSRTASGSVNSLWSDDVEYPRPASPPPSNVAARQRQLEDERRYRWLLKHNFHPSFRLPLWAPTEVLLGAVGYHDDTTGGRFVTLFNAFDPIESSEDGKARDIPSLTTYGPVDVGMECDSEDKLHPIGQSSGWRGWTTNIINYLWPNCGQRGQFELHAGHKIANLLTGPTCVHQIKDLTTPAQWFERNVNAILSIYEDEHSLVKESLFLVTGMIKARDYAMFISHEHPDGHVYFDIPSTSRASAPWGEFRVNISSLDKSRSGEEQTGNLQFSSKVSQPGGREQSVLLARLRFKPDHPNPTLH